MWKKIILSIACPALVLSSIYLTIAEGLPHRPLPNTWTGEQDQRVAVKDWLAKVEREKISTEPGAKLALAAAKEWVGLMDRGQFQEAWDRSSLHFKSSVSGQQGVAKFTQLRKQVGKLLMERTLRSLEHQINRPNAPDGEYYEIKFNAVFYHKVFGLETVVMVKDMDGKWHMSGYAISY